MKRTPVTSFPGPQGPWVMCRYHPRLANRLVHCWGDRERLERFMDDLLTDRRGGRKGLSARAVSELEALERFHAIRPGSRRDLMVFARRSNRTETPA